MKRFLRRALLAAASVLVVDGAACAQQGGLEGLIGANQPQVQAQPGPGRAANPFAAQPGAAAPQSDYVRPAQPAYNQGIQVAPGVQQVAPPGGAGKGVLSQADRDKSFERALQEAMPMSPDQIRQYRKRLDEGRRATVGPISPSVAQTRSLTLTLKPGETIPTLNVRPGVVTTLTFSDVTGRPWPVLSVVTGNPTAYVAQSAGKEGETNIIVVSPVAEHVVSNLVVTLTNSPVPISIMLDPDGSSIDYRLDVRIQSRGPNAAQDIVGVSSLAATNDITMVNFLDGVAPDGAKKLGTSSSDVEAWRFEDQLYIRTTGDVLSPSYSGRSSSVSGVNVFVMAETPVVLLSKDGRMSQVVVKR